MESILEHGLKKFKKVLDKYFKRVIILTSLKV